MNVGAATTEERPAAVRIAFGHLSNEEQRAKFDGIEEMIAAGTLPAAAMRVVRDSIGPVAAMLAAPAGHGTGIVWPPRVRVSHAEPDVALDLVVRDAVKWLGSAGVALAQCLIGAEEALSSRPLLRNGFTHPTRLAYYRHFLELSLNQLTDHERLEFRTYAEVGEQAFVEVLGQSYEGSLDCPEINVHRSADQYLNMQRDGTNFDPLQWWLAFEMGQPVGILLTDEPEPGTSHISYLGVIPSARGRGVGREMVRKALFEAKASERNPVNLAVDVRNEPAQKLYQKAGFERYDERDVYLVVCTG